MKRLIAILVAALLLFSLSGCKKTKEDLKFYVVPGEAVTATMGDQAILRAAKKEGRVAFTGENLAGWLWEEHRVQLKDLVVEGGNTDGGSSLFQADAEDLFVLTVGNKIIYVGGFLPAGGSVKALRNPYIQDGTDDTFYLLIDRKYEEGEDPRANAYLYDYLVDQQLLVSAIQPMEGSE
ncbi:MAG: hypothetical protein IJP27_05170 [Clostridia bacterium]|nr:hypothetical protein [Clostridia bacterium]